MNTTPIADDSMFDRELLRDKSGNIKGHNVPSALVARGSFEFVPTAGKPSLEENRYQNTPPHPLDIFRSLADENCWLDLGVRVICSAVCSTSPLFNVEGNGKEKKVAESFTDKLLHPNKQQTGYEFFYETTMNLAIYGNCFWHVIKDRAGGVHSIYIIPPYRIRIAHDFDAQGNIKFTYHYYGNEGPKEFNETNMVHFKTPNHKSFLWGKPPIYSGVMNVIVDEDISKWVQSFFSQSLSAGAVFRQDADEEVAGRNRLWLATEHCKPEHAGEPMILEGNLELVSEGSKFKDLDYKQLKQTSKEDILNHLGVPLSQAGVRSDSGQANVEVINAEEESFIRNTVQFYQRLIYDKIEHSLFGGMFGKYNLTIKPGLMNRFNNANAIRIAEAGSKVYMKIDEHRKLLGFQPIGGKLGDVGIVASNNGVIPAAQIYGVDEDGKPIPTILEKEFELKDRQMKLQEKTQKDTLKMAEKAASEPAKGADLNKAADTPKKIKSVKSKQPGTTNLASQLTNPTSRQ